MLVRRNLPLEKAFHTVKINHMAEDAITTQGNQVIETKVINMLDSRVRFKITVEVSFSMGSTYNTR